MVHGFRNKERMMVGLVALVLAAITVWAAVSAIGAGATKPMPPNVALTGQNQGGAVTASGPLVGQSVFPGEATARRLVPSNPFAGEDFIRSVALTGQNHGGAVAASGPLVGQAVFPGEALARSLAATDWASAANTK